MKFFNKNSNRVIGTILQIVVGILLIINPAGFTSGIIVATGVVLTIAGIVNIVRYFVGDPVEAAAEQLLTKGLIFGAAGLFCVFNSYWFIGIFPVLTVLYGAAILVSGLMKIQLSTDLLRAKRPRWFMPGIGAILSVICGLVVLFNPFTTTGVIWKFAGISLIVTGVFDLVAAIISRDKKSKNDEIIQ